MLLLLLSRERSVCFVDDRFHLGDHFRHFLCEIDLLVGIFLKIVDFERLHPFLSLHLSKGLPFTLANRLGDDLLVVASAEFPVEVVVLLLLVVLPL